MKGRMVLESAGFALLMVLPFIFPLLVPGSTALLHQRLSFWNPLAGLLFDIAFLFLLGVVACLVVRYLPPLGVRLISGFFVGFVLWWAVFGAITLTLALPIVSNAIPGAEFNIGEFLGTSQGKVLQLNSVLPMLFVGIAFIKPAIVAWFARKVSFALAAFSFCALWIIPEIIYIAAFDHPTPSFDLSTKVAQPDFDKRIVWLLFDELSYKLAVENTPQGVELPNFHKVARQSVTFGNIEPAGFYTDRIVPSLLAGKEIQSIKSTWSGSLLYRENHHWLQYDQNLTLFGIARDHGWEPGLVGWYNPYCRMFANVLTSCSWQPGIQAVLPFQRIGATRNATVLENAFIVPRFFLTLFTGLGGSRVVDLLDRNQRDYQILLEESQKLIGNGQVHFVFIHAPVPHPPGFYDRKRHALCHCGNYLDNLVLADDTLGMLRGAIDRSPWADRTILIVSSDHSWRIPLWNKSGDWTPEEAAISKGVYDPRPVFLVHFPGQTTGSTVMTPIPELREHDVIASMLRGKVDSPEALNAAMTQQTETASSR